MRMSVDELLKRIGELGDSDDVIYTIAAANRFKKHLARAYRRNLDLGELLDIVAALAEGQPLDAKYRPHTLHGFGTDVRECHIRPDWLLVWQQDDDKLILILLDTGSHSDLF